MKKVSVIVQWILAIFLAICVLGNGVHFSSVFLLVATIIAMPISASRKLFGKLKIKNWLLILLAAIFFLMGVYTSPQKDVTELPEESVFSPIDINNEEDVKGVSFAQNGALVGGKEKEDTYIDSLPVDDENIDDIPIDDVINSNEESTGNSDDVVVIPKEPCEDEVPVDEAPAPSREEEKTVGNGKATPVSLSEIPEYSGIAYTVVNDNIPNFSTSELTILAYEWYSPLDTLGRCGMAIASCGKEIMPSPDEERGNISDVKPSGWIQAKYDGVSGGYLWNRCHLIGWQLSAENANEKNLITGTRSMNVDGMLLFENMVADYVKETGNHVAYRITPIYDGDELVCRGVQMEAYSIEDDGEGISFNVYCYNVQPGIVIDYATGESHAEKEITEPETASVTYVLNTNTKRVHYPSCHSVKQIAEKNYAESSEALDALVGRGYKPCGNCMK